MFKTVIDTNVIISAIAFGGVPGEVLNLVITGKIINHVSEYILDELKEVLQRPKFNYDLLIIKAVLHEMESLSEYVDSVKITGVMSTIEAAVQDQDDNFFIACAIAAEADYLVTGDNDLLVLKKEEKIKVQIVTPAQFMEL